jgi:hypothetical protein
LANPAAEDNFSVGAEGSVVVPSCGVSSVVSVPSVLVGPLVPPRTR